MAEGIPESVQACLMRTCQPERRSSSSSWRTPGVEVCFGLPGVHNLPLWEALRESGIRLVGVRHEQAAAYAADGYARRERQARRRADDDRAGCGEHARRGRRGVGVADADPRDRDRHPEHAAARGRLPRRAARDRGQADMFRPGHGHERGRRGTADDVGLGIGAALAAPPAGPSYLEVPTDLLRRRRRAPHRGRDRRRAARRRATDPYPLIDAAGAAADLGGIGRARPRRRGSGRWPSGSPRRCSPRSARAGCSRPSTPPRSGCRRTSRRPAGCGTRPTW